MKSKFNLVPVFLIVCTNLILGQFKTIENHPVEQEDREKLLNPDFRYEIKPQNNLHEGEINFKSLNAPDIYTLQSGLSASYVDGEVLPLYIHGLLNSEYKKRQSPEGAAFDYLTAAGPFMGLKDADAKFVIQHIEKDALQYTHVRMQQVYKGMPVYGAEVILHGKDGEFDFLNGRYHKDFDLENMEPRLTDAQVRNIIEGDMNSVIFEPADDISSLLVNAAKSSLVIYFHEGIPHLTWHFTVYKNISERREYFVDANSGKILDTFTSICKLHYRDENSGHTCNHSSAKPFIPLSISKVESDTEDSALMDGKATAIAQDLFNINRNINTFQVGNRFYLIDAARDIFSPSSIMPNDPVGVLWTIDAFNTSPDKNTFRYDHISSTNNTWPSKTSISSHYNSGQAFEYFRNTHNRRSINGNGGNIISLINVADTDGSSMGNAFWNGLAIFYGNGDSAFRELARGLDVAGHEMSHGVIQSTANLEYRNESGALNESFADIFGAMIDRDDWLIGEDVVRTSAFPSGALRNMQDPHNGAAVNDFNKGWQPKHYNERFTGSADNGGVHINSGIPNHAFFRYATAIGKDKAERVFYRALTNYLTKSSRFVDCRVAVIKAATDLHGANSQEVSAARNAFDAVGIAGEQGGNYEVDVNANPGQEFVLTVGSNFNGISISRPDGTNVGNISNRAVLSKPSISDDGSDIVYVGTDNHIYNITINWNTSQVQEQRLSNTPVWRNVVISKDGTKVAALEKELKNEIVVFHFGNTVTSAAFELYNPTFTQDVNTGDVKFADAMEFDITGEYVMYDAQNEIKSNTASSIEYWDIGFLKVWNNQTNTFSLGNIDKLFPALPSGVSVGNPTFSKNSPYIIAFDYLEDDKFYILGSNIERGQVSLLWENNDLGYPNYSSLDNRLVFDNKGNTNTNIGIMNLKSNKIEPAAQPTLFLTNRRWATWFSNGTRVLSDVSDLNISKKDVMDIYPNPASGFSTLRFSVLNPANLRLNISDISGRSVYSQSVWLDKENNHTVINLQGWMPGIYIALLEDPKSGRIIQTGRFIVAE